MVLFGFVECLEINTLTANYGVKLSHFIKLTSEPLR